MVRIAVLLLLLFSLTVAQTNLARDLGEGSRLLVGSSSNNCVENCGWN